MLNQCTSIIQAVAVQAGAGGGAWVRTERFHISVYLSRATQWDRSK